MNTFQHGRSNLVVWSLYFFGASVIVWYFGWLVGLFIAVWAKSSLLGMTMVIKDGNSKVGLRLLYLGLLMNSFAFWFVGPEAFPLFSVFGVLVIFGAFVSDLVRKVNDRWRATKSGVLGSILFLSALLGPRFGLVGYELHYTTPIYVMVVICEFVIVYEVRGALLDVAKSIQIDRAAKERLVEAKTWYVESFGMISHNIKNPLAVIVSRLELAQLKSKLKGTVELSSMEVQELRAKADEINTLLMQFLALHKDNSKKLEKGPITLRELVVELANTNNCRLVELSDKVSSAQLDEVSLFALRQALEVLIDNAKKYAGHVPEITLSERGVRVRDYGPGLTDEQAAVYGKQFVESRSLSGSGIGLFFAAQLLKKSGWNMRLIDHNNGLTVKIEPTIPQA